MELMPNDTTFRYVLRDNMAEVARLAHDQMRDDCAQQAATSRPHSSPHSSSHLPSCSIEATITETSDSTTISLRNPNNGRLLETDQYPEHGPNKITLYEHVNGADVPTYVRLDYANGSDAFVEMDKRTHKPAIIQSCIPEPGYFISSQSHVDKDGKIVRDSITRVPRLSQ